MRKFFALAVVFVALTLFGSQLWPVAIARQANERIARAVSDVKTLTTAVHAYRIQFGDWPATLEKLVDPPDRRRPFLSNRR